ncbi:hypothetical protein NEUTE2DRAFT_109922 [Neurospora tetrasperma FGSC 2509]|nr:hypothetical protein NEUTE2DRAFT_109922 [Neurospora tetrasperma FGSC 2509]
MSRHLPALRVGECTTCASTLTGLATYEFPIRLSVCRRGLLDQYRQGAVVTAWKRSKESVRRSFAVGFLLPNPCFLACCPAPCQVVITCDQRELDPSETEVRQQKS